MLRKLLIGVGVVLAVAVVGLAGVYIATGPEGPPADSMSATLLEPGPYAVIERDLTFIDESRPTRENGDFPGAATRTLPTTLWYPRGEVAGGMPLVVYCHGFMSNRQGGNYLARALASRGYLVASADFPLTHMGAPGGPNAADVDQQPADVSFIIDSLLALQGADKLFDGDIDPVRIGVMGLSLGGLTATLVGYHPRWRDDRMQAVVSIAGPAAGFTRRFFLNGRAQFLMIAGTADAIVDYETHAADIPEKVTGGVLLTIRNASHTGFVSLAEPAMRLMDHPDSLACSSLAAQQEEGSGENPFTGLGDLSDGINPELMALQICTKPLGKALHPGRQHMIAEVGVVDFFTSQFDEDAHARRAAREHLRHGIGEDFPEARTTY
jgi:predicted dienelactone hydrolase